MRLFVALDLPDDVKAYLAGLCGGLPGARWTRPNQFHLTLKFIGEIDHAKADDVAETLCDIDAEPFDLKIKGLGIFGAGSKRPHMLFAKVEECPRLMSLRDKIEYRLTRIGIKPEHRKFIPHVSLARLKDSSLPKLESFMTFNAFIETPKFTVESFSLFQSFLHSEGSIYRTEALYPFGMGLGYDPGDADLDWNNPAERELSFADFPWEPDRVPASLGY